MTNTKNNQNDQELVKPQFKRLNQCLNCRKCAFYSSSVIGRCSGCPDHMGECFKRFGLLWILYWGITAFILAFFFHKMYFEITEQKFFYSLLATLLLAFPIDIICYFLEKGYINFFLLIEKRRKEKFKLKLQQYELMIEAKEKKEKVVEAKVGEFEKIELLHENLLEFYSKMNISDLKHLTNSTTIKNNFKKMLDAFNELINILEPEMLENISLRHFLTIHMDEFVKLSNKFLEERYSLNEETEYICLIEKVCNKLNNYIAQVKNSTILDFNISIRALSKAMGDNDLDTSKGED